MRWHLGLLAIPLWGQVLPDSVPAYVLPSVTIQDSLAGSQKVRSVSEGLPERLPFARMVYRSVPFAQEVVYQGFLPQQVQLAVGGMRIHPACVDRMDPVLTFVEPAEVESVEEAPWRSWGAGPLLEVGLFSPEGPAEGQATLLAADVYHRLFASVRHRGGQGRLRWASAGTFRLGGPYRTGRQPTPGLPLPTHTPWYDTTLNLPPFRKLNLYTALSYTLSPNHTLELLYLGDAFYDVAYPALIMDARHSAMHLVSLRHRWGRFSDLRLYANTVFHDMTDEERPLSEIQHRIVMPGMYMPMRGLTRVVGMVWEGQLLAQSPFELRPRLEGTWNQAWGSMDMYLVGGGTPMRLLNLADIRFLQGAAGLQARYAREKMAFQTEATLTHFAYWVADTTHFLPLELYQRTYAGGANPTRTFTLYQVGASLQVSHSIGTFSVSLRHGTRAPTHTELYGYYLYVPMDNSLWMGNSLLRPERLWRAELRWRFAQPKSAFQITAYANRMADYIAPVTFLAVGAPGNNTQQAWRILQNTGLAWTAGFTVEGTFRWAGASLSAQSGYTWGWHATLREPLPWIYPLFLRVAAEKTWGRHTPSIEAYAAAAQPNLSRTIYPEDKTPPYGLLHLSYRYLLWQRPHWRGTLLLRAENLLNTYGWDHLSVGNWPFLGRVLRAGITVGW